MDIRITQKTKSINSIFTLLFSSPKSIFIQQQFPMYKIKTVFMRIQFLVSLTHINQFMFFSFRFPSIQFKKKRILIDLPNIA